MKRFKPEGLALIFSLVSLIAPQVMAADFHDEWSSIMQKGKEARNQRDYDQSAKFFKEALDYAETNKLGLDFVERSLGLYTIVLKRGGHLEEAEKTDKILMQYVGSDLSSHRQHEYRFDEETFKAEKNDEWRNNLRKEFARRLAAPTQGDQAKAVLHITPVRYKLTIEVKADGVIHKGSSVVEISFYPSRQEIPMILKVRGEAVSVDLGSRGTLFSLLTNESHDYDPQILLFPLFRKFAKDANLYITQDLLDAANQFKGKVEIPPNKLPMLVHFRDLNDPLSVERVNPDQIDYCFGHGAKITSATLVITNEPVSSGIEKKLSWLKNLADKHQNLAAHTGDEHRKLAEELSTEMFKSETRAN